MNKRRFKKNSYININRLRVGLFTCLFCGDQFKTTKGLTNHQESHKLEDGGYNYDKKYRYNLRTIRGDFRGKELGAIYYMQEKIRRYIK